MGLKLFISNITKKTQKTKNEEVKNKLNESNISKYLCVLIKSRRRRKKVQIQTKDICLFVIFLGIYFFFSISFFHWYCVVE
jgi:hypothetical protein